MAIATFSSARRRLFRAVAGSALALCLAWACAWADAPAPEVPAWRGETPGTDFLGPDVLWRPREGLIFYMWNDAPEGFGLTLTLRDMKTYHQGERPVKVWVVAPNGDVVADKLIQDEGYVAGHEKYRDGVYDQGQDFRYRSWHRAHSPDGYPEDKQRNPYLETPERLTPRAFTLSVPAAGVGEYRVVVLATWDHWVSLTPDRPMPAAVHPGHGPLYMHPGRLEGGAYLYVPEFTEQIGISTTEEIMPFNWSVELLDPQGEVVASTRARRFMNYAIHDPAQRGAVYRLRATGETTGACLHIEGLPMLLAPDRETAELFKGGVQRDAKGRISFHPFQRTLYRWADSLTVEDLAVDADVDLGAIGDADVRELVRNAAAILRRLPPDPEDEAYLGLRDGRGDAHTLAQAVSTRHAGNPFYAHPAVVRRIALGQVAVHADFLPAFSWRQYCREFPTRFEFPASRVFAAPWRSNYLNFEPGRKRVLEDVLLPIALHLDAALPVETLAALKKPFELWTYARSVEHMGESSNKWLMNIAFMRSISKFFGEPERIERLIDRQLDRILTPGAVGRANPDPTPYRSAAGFTYAGPADIGMTGAGYLSEQWGFDAGYADNSERYAAALFREYPDDERITNYFEWLYFINTHLSLPRHGRMPDENIRREIVSPTDMYSRLEQVTNRTYMPDGIRDRITYGDLWALEQNPRRTWPALETEPFARVLDDKFFFVNAPSYYSIHYRGNTSPDWRTFTVSDVDESSGDFVGYTEALRDISQRKTTKPGGLSAVFVRGVGPTFLALNHDVMYANNLWGRRREPVVPKWEGEIDPRVVSSGFVDPEIAYDVESRVFRKSGAFLYEPLHFTRTLQFLDDRILVTLDVLALGELGLTELNESLPFFVGLEGERVVRVFGGDLSQTREFAGHEARAGEVRLRALQIGNAEGAGTTIILEDEIEAAMIRPYRGGRSPRLTVVSSVQLPLPHALRAGEQFRLRYVVYSHEGAVSEDDLRRVAEETF